MEDRIVIGDNIELFWEEYAWEGEIILSAWIDYRFGYLTTADELSDGTVCAIVDSSSEGECKEPSSRQVSALEWIVENDTEVHDAIVKALYEQYPTLQKKYNFSGKEALLLMPDLESPEDLKELIGPTEIHLHDVQKGDVPYVGIQFNCTWDDEGGLGVLMHGLRVVEIGAAETARFAKYAKEDAKK